MSINKIAVYGFGLIGGGWVTHLLVKNKTSVIVYDIDEAAIDKGKEILKRNMDFLVREGIFSEEQKNELLGCVKYTTDIAEAVSDADLIIENGPEIIDIKQSIIRAIEEASRPDALITSSTSGLLITEIAKKASHPERIFGCHPYHPVYLLPLLEMTKMDCTDLQKLTELEDFFRSIDKKPVVLKKPSDGYIGSHLMTALLRESINLVTSGVCDIKDIDDAFLYGPGMRYGLLGIFSTLQLGGGEGGFTKMMNGPIGKSTDKWLKNYANWTSWPEEAKDIFANSQDEINEMLDERDEHHGRNNAEIEVFRDRGLIRILQAHKMI